ncbi:hypothetical protein [Peribacillus alkalitolerans]|uniref:hypothetical protein n=1 Tax=Peribacillus alkalitolerans TaxID=1550385 RepID=UPI0013CFB385|nr:hypothetical protein [Peribacillus alkalitolerans]
MKIQIKASHGLSCAMVRIFISMDITFKLAVRTLVIDQVDLIKRGQLIIYQYLNLKEVR